MKDRWIRCVFLVMGDQALGVVFVLDGRLGAFPLLSIEIRCVSLVVNEDWVRFPRS